MEIVGPPFRHLLHMVRAFKIHTIKTYPLKIPKKKPKTLSTEPRPVYENKRPRDFPVKINRKSDKIYIAIPRPNPETNSF